MRRPAGRTATMPETDTSHITQLTDVLRDQGNSHHPDANVLDWIFVALMVVGAVVGAVALISASIWIGAVAAFLAVAGAVGAVANGTINHTEDYGNSRAHE